MLLFVSDNVPEELKDAFYIDQYEQEHIKPPVLKLLLSSELYCRVCGLILKGDQVAALQGHQPVIEALSHKGIYVMESEDTPVSEVDLSCAPIKMVRVDTDFSRILHVAITLSFCINGSLGLQLKPSHACGFLIEDLGLKIAPSYRFPTLNALEGMLNTCQPSGLLQHKKK